MGIRLWLRNFLEGDSGSHRTEISCGDLQDLNTELALRSLAFSAAVSKVARSIAKCEIKTYLSGKEVKQDDYYRLNIQPNKNQNSSAWIQKLITQLYLNNEALVIETFDHDLLVADSFDKKVRAVYDWSFSDVRVDDWTFPTTYQMSDVFYFRLNNDNVKHLIDQACSMYGKIIEAAGETMSQQGGVKAVINMQGLARSQNLKDKDDITDLFNNKLKYLWTKRNAVIPLQQGMTYQDLNKGQGWASTRDYRELVNDIYDLTASAFGIPPVILRGEVAGTKDAFDMYLTDCIDPLADLISTEITSKMYSKSQWKSGSKVLIDTTQVKHLEIFDLAASVEKLIGSGVMTINEVRPRLGYEESNDELANKLLITKNFTTLEDATGEE